MARISLPGQQLRKDPPLPTQVRALLKNTLAQTKIMNCDDANPLARQDGTTFHYSIAGLSIAGKDKRGRDWSTVVAAGGPAPCEVWTAKLGGSSHNAYIMLNMSDAASNAYRAELTILLFDAESRPVPWQAIGRFTLSKRGVVQIVALVKNRSGIVISTRSGEGRQEAGKAGRDTGIVTIFTA